ncbi:MAG: exonuclease SbcCD subunit D [Solobacterium sp.]|nr:exonuclease SbcCD subunit D [Solobacterium sp.]
MKFYHLADLHFGKSIYGLSMLDDQRYWADQFIAECRECRPNAIVIAGDVYDRAAPSGDAVELLDYMLTKLADLDIPVMLIAGNHDSGQRLSFGHSLLAKQNIHIAGTAKKELVHIPLKDEYGPVTFWLLPYTYPDQVIQILGDEEIHTYDQAVRRLLEEQEIDLSQRNVIIAHQNVTANGMEAERGGSETMVGGIGQVDYTAFDGFEYAALGHIHRAYPVGRKEVRFAGTPLCYHMNETMQENKGYTEVILRGKGEEAEIHQRSIEPLHKMRYLKDTKDAVYALLKNDTGRDEYIGITITDERITPEINNYLKGLLSSRGSILMELLSTYSAFSGTTASAEKEAVETKALEDLFADLYTDQSGGTPPEDDEYELMQYAGELIRHMDTHGPLNPKDILKMTEKAMKIGGEAK